MITDENGVKHPECVADEVQLRKEQEEQKKETATRFFNRKANREGWNKPTAKEQGTNCSGDGKKRADRFFAQKAKREGWGE